MVKVVLTADRSVFTDYSGCSSLGFGLCLPYRLIPGFLEYRVLAPPIPVVDGYRAKYAPYPLAKLRHHYCLLDLVETIHIPL